MRKWIAGPVALSFSPEWNLCGHQVCVKRMNHSDTPRMALDLVQNSLAGVLAASTAVSIFGQR